MVRRFKLMNANGAEWDLMRFDAFFHAPDGLGISRSISSIRTGGDYLETDSFPDQRTVTGEMVFMNYSIYKDFVGFVSADPLLLFYAPENTWYRVGCRVQFLGKTEIKTANRLICPVQFLCTGMWHESATVETDLEGAESPKTYPYGYNYTYFDATLGGMAIQNGNLESPVILSIFGPVQDPSWSLTQGGSVVSTGAVSALITEGNKLVVDSRPDRMEIAEYTQNGEYVRNLYQYSDFSTDRFVYAPPGESLLSVTGTGGVTIVGKNKLQNTQTSQTIRGVDITVNDDGSVSVAGGQTVTGGNVLIEVGSVDNSSGKTLIATGVAAGADVQTTFCGQLLMNGSAIGNFTESGRTFSNAGVVVYRIFMRNGYTTPSGGLVFYPMIRPDGTPSAYEPYSEITVIQAVAEVEKNAYSV